MSSIQEEQDEGLLYFQQVIRLSQTKVYYQNNSFYSKITLEWFYPLEPLSKDAVLNIQGRPVVTEQTKSLSQVAVTVADHQYHRKQYNALNSIMSIRSNCIHRKENVLGNDISHSTCSLNCEPRTLQWLLPQQASLPNPKF